MNLIRKYNVSSFEDDMQAAVVRHFIKHPFKHDIGYGYTEVKCDIYREVYIPEIRRRSDVILRVTDQKIFNIECKNNDVAGVIAQAKDHLAWCDYSYICLHALTYIPTRDIKTMIDLGIGLLLWQGAREYDDRPAALVDVISAMHNPVKGGLKRPALRKKVMLQLKKATPIK